MPCAKALRKRSIDDLTMDNNFSLPCLVISAILLVLSKDSFAKSSAFCLLSLPIVSLNVVWAFAIFSCPSALILATSS